MAHELQNPESMVENNILDFWEDAQKKFITTAAYQKYGGAFNEAILDPSKWAEMLERSLEKSEGPLREICRKVGRHIEAIQSAINIANEVFQIVAGVPAASPATIILQGFALLFKAFAATQKNVGISESFFADTKALFEEISIISEHLHDAGDRTLNILRSRIATVFCCSLKFCAIAVENRDGWFKKGIKLAFKEGTELSKLLSKMQFAKNQAGRSGIQETRGTGKSVLALIIIRHLQNVATKDKSEPVIAFLYMSHKRETTVRDLLGSVVRQIVAEMPLIPSIIEEAWNLQTSCGKYNGKYPKPHEEILTNFLSNLLSNRPFYIVLDAMDECVLPSRKPLLDSLKRVNEDVRILVTARLPEKQDKLSKGFSLQVIKALESDIDEYIDSEIDNDSTLQKNSGQPLLHRAVFRNNKDIVKVILDKTHLVDIEDRYHRTAFTAYAGTEHGEILEDLISQGADINHTNFRGIHELSRAAAFGNTNMVIFSLDVGVNPSITDKIGWTPLHEASANGQIRMCQAVTPKRSKTLRNL
ncbi:43a614c7-b8bf-44ee-8771-6ab77bbda0d8 [Sclerotinia trifoliorum]|uniref:43a614c7-b8bf-44ee-8771-6ab77bbda0d8 n=1 Tax=Sclerotinia trifoliorum TaxID=28548 RepID=A0A8H2ZTG3_9HELO|nr:43a614c7-b8bf-44ee-8771-6ab77bbda0d8 [Sclerotinia trifoliorum]